VGEVSPHHPTKGSGQRRNSPPAGSGAPAENFLHILGQKEATRDTIFSIFERRRRTPNVAGPGKTPPPPRRAWGMTVKVECAC